MASNHNFALSAKRKACDNFLDNIRPGPNLIFLKNNSEICNMGSREDQKLTNAQFCDAGLRLNKSLFVTT